MWKMGGIWPISILQLERLLSLFRKWGYGICDRFGWERGWRLSFLENIHSDRVWVVACNVEDHLPHMLFFQQIICSPLFGWFSSLFPNGFGIWIFDISESNSLVHFI